jgi:nucleotide-binding universal stress UspA family protein
MKILLATDGSRHARQAVRLLRTLARERDFDVEVVAVLPPATPFASGDADADAGNGSVLPRLEDQVPPETAREWLAAAAADLTSSGLNVRTDLLVGTPEEALVERCREGGHDLIVAGVKGRGATPFFELGRVATHLVRWSPASVLLVRKRMGRTAARTGTATSRGFRILLPTDGHAECLEASRKVLEALSPDQARVEILNVEEPSEARDGSRRWLSNAVVGLTWGRALPRSNTLQGRPAAAIARWASASETDLVVLGTGRPLGSTASRLGRTGRELAWSSPCSVLMVRS